MRSWIGRTVALGGPVTMAQLWSISAASPDARAGIAAQIPANAKSPPSRSVIQQGVLPRSSSRHS